MWFWLAFWPAVGRVWGNEYVEFRPGAWNDCDDFWTRGLTFFFFLLSYSDYINPIDLCNRLNAYIIPEAAVHAFLTFLFVINGYWLAIILNLPLFIFNAKKCVPIPAWVFVGEVGLTWIRILENQHLLDATEIFRKLNVHKKVISPCYGSGLMSS